MAHEISPLPDMPALFSKIFAALLAFLFAGGAHAQERSPRQEHGALRQTVEDFLHAQASGLPGQASITVGAVDRRLNLSACTAPEAFLPSGSRAWGKTVVGVRCIAPSPWTVYIPATVQVQGDYIAAAVPLSQGKSIGPNDITTLRGDLTVLPAGIITDPSQAIGRTLSVALPLGAPLRQDALRNQQVIQQGQVVRLVSTGPGFRVSSEGRALNNAIEGQIAQARTPGGQVVSGVAKVGGIVEVMY